MKDAAGKTLKVGQIADLSLIGLYHGRIMEIHEAVVMTGPTKAQVPQVVISVIIPLVAEANGVVEGLYVVRDAPPEAPKLEVVN